jgi:hypothetical protein
MAKLFSALLFAAALIVGLGAVSSVTYACNDQTAQADNATGLVQLAQDESSGDDQSNGGSDESANEGSSGGGESE